MRPPVLALLAGLLLLGATAPVAAQAPSDASTTRPPEGPDATRLDVERLPVEAIEVTRDLFRHGLYVEGWVGGRGFIGGAGRYSRPGLYANVGVGMELLSFLWVRVAVEASIHATDAPPPPSPTAFELLGAVGELRLQVDFSARVALWLGGEVGAFTATGDVLPGYGFTQSRDLGLMYGGSLGFDWHLLNRHYSMGLLAGARLYPHLDSLDGERAIGIHSAAYLRYVF